MELPQNVIESELPEQKAPIQQKTNDLWSQLGQSFMKESIPNLDYKPEAPQPIAKPDNQNKVLLASMIKDPNKRQEHLLNKLNDDKLALSDKESDLEIEFEPSSPRIKLDVIVKKPEEKKAEPDT